MPHEENTANGGISRRVWCVLHVRARREKQVDEILAGNGRWHYLPLYKKTRKVQRRKVVSLLPLFPGYVFTRLNASERFEIRKTKKIANIIIDPRPRETIHQLRQIRRAASGAPAIRIAPLFTAGDRVRVKEGPLFGLEGIIVRDRGKTSIALNMTLLGQSILVDVNANACEKI